MLDPERLAEAIGAAAGGLVYGLFHLVTLVIAGQSPTSADYWRACLNVVAAIIAGALTAYFLAPAITAALPFEALRDPLAVGFVIGALGWELIPLIISAAKRYVSKLGAR